MSSNCFFIREFGEIHHSKANQQINIDKIELNSSAFKALEKITESNNKDTRFLKFKKSSVLKVQNFVGVITTPDGTQIEILPKIETIADENSASKSREILAKMLEKVYELPFIQTTKAPLKLKNMPLPEVLIAWFLRDVDNIIKQGIRRNYLGVSAHEKFLKGQLQITKQLNQPPDKQHLFHIEYDFLSPNRAENRLIHSALLQVLKWSKHHENQKMTKHFLMFLEQVPVSHNIKSDFEQWSNSREMDYYQPILPWLTLILNQQSPFALKDKNIGISFLLPMEVLFEKYVAKILQENSPSGYRIITQSTGKHLSIHPKAFALKPDILIKKGEKTICVLDTKWKRIEEDTTHENGNIDHKKGISQADVYQLFAYGKKYGVAEVGLIYPQWEKFTQSFSFQLDNNLQLNIMPFSMQSSEDNNFQKFI